MHTKVERPGAAAWQRLAPFLVVGLVFVCTRIALLLLTVREEEFVLPSVTNDVKYIYSQWFNVLVEGRFPADDVMWQYPPAAALVMLAPALLPWDYVESFYWLSFGFDVLTFVVLARASRSRLVVSQARAWRTLLDRRTQPWAVWVWTLGVAIGGPIAYGRYDLIVTSVAVCGLVLLAGRTPEGARPGRRRGIGGALIAFGAMLKVWPALLLLVLGPTRRVWQAWVAAVAAGAALTGAFYVSMPNALSFLSAQGGRGIEIESIGALPFHVAIHHGWEGRVALNYGSMEYLGPYVQLVATLSLAASLIALFWLAYWRTTVKVWRDSTVADAALVAVLLFVVTSRVISPQYMVWLVGLAAVCALHWRGVPSQHGHSGRRGDSVMVLPVALILMATALSCVEFPYYFDELMRAERGAVLLVTVRNVLLVAAALIGANRLWRSTRAVKDAGQADVHLPAQRMANLAGEQSAAM
ncbi:MAG: glycosyltransferase 87 family protein [Sporichthyaceae bacterium]